MKYKKIKITDLFYSIQGEGTYIGTPAFFIRTFGCPIKCNWCDSKESWCKKYKKNIKVFTQKEILKKINQKIAKIIILTGGEPSIWNFEYLIKKSEIPIHIETSGCFKLHKYDWITLSPKKKRHPKKSNLKRANEFKIIICNLQSIEYWEKHIGKYYKDKPVWLIPEWSKIKNFSIINYITNHILKQKYNYKLGIQEHKFYEIK